VLGVVAALGLTRVLSTLLFDVRPADPLTYVAVSALLGATALMAAWLPARRAAEVDAAIAMRAE
jgi:ABC-type lipoprotein release transport system permease subunit